MIATTPDFARKHWTLMRGTLMRGTLMRGTLEHWTLMRWALEHGTRKSPRRYADYAEKIGMRRGGGIPDCRGLRRAAPGFGANHGRWLFPHGFIALLDAQQVLPIPVQPAAVPAWGLAAMLHGDGIVTDPGTGRQWLFPNDFVDGASRTRRNTDPHGSS